MVPGSVGPPEELKTPIEPSGCRLAGVLSRVVLPACKTSAGLVVKIVKCGSVAGIDAGLSGAVIAIFPPLMLPIASTLSETPV